MRRMGCLARVWTILGFALFAGRSVTAADGTWTGASDSMWTNDTNWSAAPYAGFNTNEKATFDSDGSGFTTLNIAGLYSIGSTTFDTPNVAAYTIGAGGPNVQTLIVGRDGVHYLTAAAGNSQTFNAAIQLGGDRSAGAYLFRNENTTKTLTIAGNVAGPSTGGTAAGKVLLMQGAGNLVFSGNVSAGGATALTITNSCTGTLTLSGSNIVKTLVLNGSTPSVVDIGAGYLSLENSGSTVLYSAQGGSITGSGRIRLSMTSNNNYADNYIASGKTLIINPSIIGTTGFELTTGTGMFVLTATNTFTENVLFSAAGTISVATIGNKKSLTSNLGQGTNITFNSSGARLLYTGSGESTDRILNFKNNCTIENAGTGALNFTTNNTCSSSYKTVTFVCAATGSGEYSGILRGDLGNLGIVKTGLGDWRFTGANTYTGLTTVSQGVLQLAGANGAIASSYSMVVGSNAILRVLNTAASNHVNRLGDSSPISLTSASLVFANDAGTASFSETVGPVTVNGLGNVISAAQAASGRTATVTLGGLTRMGTATLNFSGAGLGASDRNRVFITGQADGPMGSWVTVNGSPATYSSALGVYVSGLVGIAAKGDVIVSNDTSNVSITTAGTTGPITLSSDATVIGSLAQTTTYDATVDTAGKSLRLSSAAISSGATNLTIGVAPSDGALSTPTAGGELTLGNVGGGALTVNAVIADNEAPVPLTKTGAGPVVLGGANTFSGNLTVGQGSLILANSLALQNVLFANPTGIVFDSSVASHGFTIGNLTNSFNFALVDNAGNPIALSAGNNNGSSTFGGVLSGAGSLSKVGSGTLTLSGASSFSGGATISGGSLSVGLAGGLGTGGVINNGTLNLTATGTVTYTGLSTTLAGNGTLNVTLGSGATTTALVGDYSGFTGTWNLGATGVGGKAYMSGSDNAAATVKVLTNAALFVSANRTHNASAILYGGDTGESYGQLRLETNAVWAGSVALAQDITGSGDGFFGANASSTTGTVSGVIVDANGAHPVAKVGAGTIRFSNAANTYAGQTSVRAGTLGVDKLDNAGVPSSLGQPTGADSTIRLGSGGTAARLAYFGSGDTSDRVLEFVTNAVIEQAGSGLLKFTSSPTFTSTRLSTITLDGSTSGEGEIAAPIADGVSSNRLVKAGLVRWTLSAANTYSVETEIQAGTLALAHPNALPNQTGVRFTGRSQSNATLEFANDGTGESVRDITIGVGSMGTLVSGLAAAGAGINHDVGDLSLSFVTVTVRRASSVLSGSPSITMRSINLSGGNSYTTMLRPLDADLHVGPIAILSGNYSKTLRLDGTSAGSSVTGTIYNGIAQLSVIKDGAGTWTFKGSNTYSGATTVNNGTLILNGPIGSIGGSSGATLNAGGSLRLSNTAADNHPNRLRDAATVTLNGGLLDFFHTGAAADYSETVGSVAANSGSNTIVASQADSGRTSALTLSSISRGAGASVDFSGAGLGQDDRNRIFIAGQPDGLVGFWATYNGTGLAAYNSAQGVYQGAATTVGLAARGPNSVITNDASVVARINEPGEDGPITLQATDNRVAALQQCTGTPAEVATAGAVLRTQGIAIDDACAALTVGQSPGDGLLTPLSAGGKLDFANESASALTINTPIANNDTASTLAKSGTGNVVLAGQVSHSGPTLITEGSLTFASGATQHLAGVISGAGGFVKEGTNILVIANRNTYSGTTTINAGTVLVLTNAAFGATAAGTIIAPGATLDVGTIYGANVLDLGAEPFTVSGAGVDGKGAIVNNSNTSQYNCLGQVTLAGDTTFGGAQSNGRFDIRQNAPTLTMNGYTLTKTGPNMFGLTSATVVPGAGAIDVQQGTLRLESATVLGGSDANTLTLRSGARLELYKMAAPLAWSLLLADGSTFDAANNSSASTHNRWTGPVALSGAVALNGNSSYVASILGDVSGTGPLTKTGTGSVGLYSTNNTYTGRTFLTAGTLSVSNLCSVGQPCSLGQPANAADGTLSFGSGTSSGALQYFGAGDTTDRLLDLAGTTGGATIYSSGSGPLRLLNGLTFSGTGAKTLTLRGTSYAGGEIPFSLTNGPGSTLSLTKSDSGRWTLSGTNTFTGNFTIQNGTVVLTGSNSLGAANVYVADAAGDAILRMTPSSSLHGGTANLCVGNTSGGCGALYVDGGEFIRTPSTGNDQGFGFGRLAGAYGYFNMTSGSISITRIQLGPSSGIGRGIARVSGGAIRFTEWMLLVRYTGSECVFTLDGGTVNHAGASQNLCLGYDGGRGELNIRGGVLDNTGRYVSFRQNAGSPTGIVNLCGGRLISGAFTNFNSAGTSFLNFNGGVLQPSSSSTTASPFLPANLTGVYINGSFGDYAGGAAIDTAGYNVTVPVSLEAPTGNGVFGITLANPGSGYIGEPYVAITGGGGVGATAVANMEDDGTGSGTYRVASLTVTAPGVDYTSTPTVLLKSGGSSIVTAQVDTVTLAPNASAGLTKLGAGTLTLSGTNTYTGATTISNGTLKIGNRASLQSGSSVVLAGGTLDLGGLTLTNVISGAGSITNGLLRTVFSPAGEDAIGGQALDIEVRSGAACQALYRADVASNGASDVLNFSGSVNVSNFALELVDPSRLDRHQIYTILTCGGARTGTFASSNLPSSRWHILYPTDGSVKLFYAAGTLLRVR